MNGKKYIFDRLRKKYLVLQPEELVRQHMIEYLIMEKGYPETLVGNEISLTYNNLKKRCDSVVYSNDGKALMIIEYKAPNIEISQKTFDQLAIYNSQLQVKYLLVSNGLKHFCCKIDMETMGVEFLVEIPYYGELV